MLQREHELQIERFTGKVEHMVESNIQYLADKRILHVKWSGPFTVTDTKRMVDEIAARNLHPEQATILIDLRDAELKCSLSDVYGLPEYFKANVADATSFVVAHVFKSLGLLERFYKAMCTAMGFPEFQVFTDYAEAEAWVGFKQRVTSG